MKPKNINIVDALKDLRPNDRIVKVLSNKFAIVNAGLLGGGFCSENSICGLCNGKIYFYGKLETVKRFFESREPFLLNGFQFTYYNDNTYKKRFVKQNKYRQQYRKIIKLISQ